MFGESKQLGYYYRPSPNGERILLGVRRAHNDPYRARHHPHGALATIFPDLEDIRLDAHWQDFVASPLDQLPKLVIRDGIIYPTRILWVGGSLGPLAWPEGGAHDSWQG